MKFVINEVEWEIKEKSQKEITDAYNEGRDEKLSNLLGLTLCGENEIWISDNLKEGQRKRTLLHELVHCWLWSYAHAGTSNFDEEQVCDIISAMNDFLYITVAEYMKGGIIHGLRR